MPETLPTSKRITLVNTDEYVVDVEYTDHFIIVHIPYIKAFTKSSYAELREQFVNFCDFVHTIGYDEVWAGIYPEDETTNKFAGRMGFDFRGVVNGINVYCKERED